MKKTKHFKFSEEGVNPGSICTNTFLFSEIEKLGKIEDYKTMALNFPNGNLGQIFIQYLNSLNEEDTIEVVKGLYSLNSPHELTTDLYKDRKSVWGKMFDIAVRGSGKGEIPIAWLIKNAYMSGGSESYDIVIGDEKYEVKDWSLQKNSSILAGVKSKVSNFEFWDEIVDTIRRIEKLTILVDGHSKFQFEGNFDPEIVDRVNKIKQLRSKILTGEFNLSDIKLFKEFYMLISQIKYEQPGYTNIILRGPNEKPIELNIELLNIDQIANKINVNILDKNDILYILTELRRLKYVRNPEYLQIDMQRAVDHVVHGVMYIVFRENSINITNEFVPKAVSISSIRFIEKSIENNKNDQ